MRHLYRSKLAWFAIVLLVGFYAFRARDRSYPNGGEPAGFGSVSSAGRHGVESEGKSPSKSGGDSETRELSRKLADARRELEKAQETSDLQSEVLQKMLEEPKHAPANRDELATRLGGIRRRSTEFRRQWPDGAPSEGTPERDAYDAAKNVMAGDLADAMRWLSEETMAEVLSTPSDLARFQALQIFGALELSSEHAALTTEILQQHYAEAYGNGLRPETEAGQRTEDWHERRADSSRRMLEELADKLPPEQYRELEEVFGSDFMWSFSL